MEYLYAFLGVIAVLVIVVVLRTLFIRDLSPSDVQLEVNENEKMAYANGLQRLIRHKTIAFKDKPNLHPFTAMQAEMVTLFPRVHEVMKKTLIPGGSLLFHWKGKSPAKPLLLMAHQDVVPAQAEMWKYDPFSGTIENDEIYGRGTFDTKCTLFAFFQACEELISSGFIPENDVYLASSSDEEISGSGAERTVDYLEANGVKPALVLDEGGAIVQNALPSVDRHLALIGVIEKGYVNLKFTAKSSGGHSSTPPKHTPIARLAAFVNDVEKRFPLKTQMIDEVRDMFLSASRSMRFTYRMLFGNMWLFKGLLTRLLPIMNPYGRALLSTTIAFTMMKGSDAENVIPSEAYVLANLRTHPIQGIEDSVRDLSKIARKYQVECEIVEGREATPIVNTKGDSYRFLEQQIRKNFPDVLVSPYVILGGTDARFYTRISDSALRFSPIRVTNNDLKKMHGIDESLKLNALWEAVRFYRSMITDYHME
jgi:carboxypeptidase PM20D1